MNCPETIMHSVFGDVTPQQLTVYEKYGVTPEEHQQLDEFFFDRHVLISIAVKKFGKKTGEFDHKAFLDEVRAVLYETYE